MKHCALYLGYLIALLALLLLLWCAHYSYTHTGTHHFVEIRLEDDAFDDPHDSNFQSSIIDLKIKGLLDASSPFIAIYDFQYS